MKLPHVFRRRKLLLICLIASMVFSLAKVSVPVSSSPSPGTKVYAQMPPEGYINGSELDVGQIFSVYVYVENATDLNQWALSVQVDPNVLEVMGAKDGSGTVIYDYVNNISWTPGHIFVGGTANKTEGTITNASHMILEWDDLENASIGPGTAFNGNGRLCELGFRVKSQTAYSPIHLFGVLLFDGLYWETKTPHYFPPDIVEDGHYNPPPAEKLTHEVVVDGKTYNVTTESSSSISNFAFNEKYAADGWRGETSFNATGSTGTTGFCNVTIPKNLTYGVPWLVLVDDAEKDIDSGDIDATSTWLYFTYTHGDTPSLIQIYGTWVVPEFSAPTLLMTLIIVALAIAILAKRAPLNKRRRLQQTSTSGSPTTQP